jgi:hypothetical protein
VKEAAAAAVLILVQPLHPGWSLVLILVLILVLCQALLPLVLALWQALLPLVLALWQVLMLRQVLMPSPLRGVAAAQAPLLPALQGAAWCFLLCRLCSAGGFGQPARLCRI